MYKNYGENFPTKTKMLEWSQRINKFNKYGLDIVTKDEFMIKNIDTMTIDDANTIWNKIAAGYNFAFMKNENHYYSVIDVNNMLSKVGDM